MIAVQTFNLKKITNSAIISVEKQIVSYTLEVETVKTNAHREKGLVMKAWQDFIK